LGIGLNGIMTEREFAIDVVRRLREAGFEALWAGGCVRDEVMGHEPHDYDVATDARPEQVRTLYRRTIEVGASFGVVEVIGPREDGEHLKVQVATFRVDDEYEDERRPKSVRFASAQEDALRRDFTINGMFFDPLTNRLIDYVGGREDLKAKVLRAIGDPRERFKEDKLRLVRAVRFAARFELTLDAATADAIREMAERITIVSAERIAQELRKLLTDRHRVRGVQVMDDVGLIKPILPELVAMHRVPQGFPGAETGDLWEHTLLVLKHLPEEVSFPLAFATLLHDVGKPKTFRHASDRYTFHGHEHVGREMAKRIGERLKLSNIERERVEWLVERHQYLADAPIMRASRLKPILAHPGIHELLVLHRADALASGREPVHVDFAEDRLREWTASGELDPAPLLTGDDLKTMGLSPGPVFKRILDAVREGQLDGTLTSPEQAIRLAKEMAGDVASEASENGD
jgi:poly(A) polymerase